MLEKKKRSHPLTHQWKLGNFLPNWRDDRILMLSQSESRKCIYSVYFMGKRSIFIGCQLQCVRTIIVSTGWLSRGHGMWVVSLRLASREAVAVCSSQRLPRVVTVTVQSSTGYRKMQKMGKNQSAGLSEEQTELWKVRRKPCSHRTGVHGWLN